MARVLAIDLGTTLYKFTLFAPSGELTAGVQLAPPVAVGDAGTMELAPQEFMATVAAGVRQVIAQANLDLAQVDAVTFATQANSFVLLDARNQPLTPIVLWPDRRAETLETEIAARGAIPNFAGITGIPALNHQFMVAKLVWFAMNEPDVWSRVARVALLSDYLTLWLTGHHATEAGTAALSALVDIERCEWQAELVGRFGLREKWLPGIVRAGTNLGALLPAEAGRLGLPLKCQFVVGCLDQYAGAIGVGNVAPGMVSETTGTVLATVTCCESPLAAAGRGVFTGPAFCAGLYWRMVFGEVSANILQWYRDQLADQPEFATLAVLAADVSAGADGLTLRSDSRLTSLATVFEGATPQHTRGHYVRSIMEGVAAALDEQIKLLGADRTHERPHEIRSAGGGARSALWLQIKADRLCLPVVATQCPEPTSLGAAVLAEAALTSNSVDEVVHRWVRLQPARVPGGRD